MAPQSPLILQSISLRAFTIQLARKPITPETPHPAPHQISSPWNQSLSRQAQAQRKNMNEASRSPPTEILTLHLALQPVPQSDE